MTTPPILTHILCLFVLVGEAALPLDPRTWTPEHVQQWLDSHTVGQLYKNTFEKISGHDICKFTKENFHECVPTVGHATTLYNDLGDLIAQAEALQDGAVEEGTWKR